MSINKILAFCFMLCLSSALSAQMKPNLEQREVSNSSINVDELHPVKNIYQKGMRNASPNMFKPKFNFQTLPAPSKPTIEGSNLKMVKAEENGLPIMIRGSFNLKADPADLKTSSFEYLEQIKSSIRIDQPEEEFVITSSNKDELNIEHIKMQQMFQGIKVYGGEVMLHAHDGSIDVFNGRYFPTPTLQNLQAQITAEQAVDAVKANLNTFTTVKDLHYLETAILGTDQSVTELVVYHVGHDIDAEVLAYHIKIFPNIAEQWTYFVNAQTGEIIHHFTNVCKFHNHNEESHANCTHNHAHAPANNDVDEVETTSTVVGPETANATDLLGQSRLIHTWSTSGTFLMYDGSRDMFNNSLSDIPDDPVGMIITINANNTYPGNNSFTYDYITSGNNSWNNPTAVSAHFNGGEAYEYFKNTFNRNSINGQGGTIISLINVADENGNSMDNAFWNGQAMFYGNGSQAFTSPLAKALDVAGHEMSHGVVQASANLEYQGESGALNESFADVFGAMIDRDDWKVGEDITSTSIFPTGCIRDLSNPNNGGNSLSDNGWQPAHMSEKYTGSQDNGGVHINSGIPNRAYYLYATQIGKDKAEQVYYRALNNYLTASSKFVDCRNAVIQSATDLYGGGSNEVNQAANAFEAVGIGQGAGGDYQEDLEVNPGEEYIVLTDNGQTQLYLAQPDGSLVANPLSTESPISRPSVTDDGSAIIYISSDKTMRSVWIDFETDEITEGIIQDEPIWRNVAISRDGARLAALTDEFTNEILVYDFNLETWQTFTLYNPTTQTGITTGDVVFADAMEWDFTGENVMYDAQNSIENSSSGEITWWDIGILNAFDEGANNFASGNISKLFSGLQESESVGNPTFAKNSPYIIAFDYINSDVFGTEYSLRGVNLETGDLGTIFDNQVLSWPSYSVDDNKMVFDANDNDGEPVLAIVDIAANKISSVPNTATVLIGSGSKGVWFAEGIRDLDVAIEDLEDDGQLNLFPNPLQQELNIQFDANENGKVQIEILDVLGKVMQSTSTEFQAGENQLQLSVKDLAVGTYFVRLNIANKVITRKVLKLK